VIRLDHGLNTLRVFGRPIPWKRLRRSAILRELLIMAALAAVLLGGMWIELHWPH